MARPSFLAVANLIAQRVQARRHILVGQPLGSLAYEQGEFLEVRTLPSAGKLIWATPDGCMLGYRDRESVCPYKNAMRCLVSSEVIVNYLSPHAGAAVATTTSSSISRREQVRQQDEAGG